MNVARAVCALALLSSAAAAHGQILNERKPGLWELQIIGDDGRAKAKQAELAERLARVPPEKRAPMQAYLNERGMGISAGPNGAPVMTMRFCLTPQQIAEESGRGFVKGLEEQGDCTPKVVAQSAREVRIQAHCRASSGGTTDSDVRIFDIAADHYSVDLKGSGPHGEVHMQQKARWLGSECNGAF